MLLLAHVGVSSFYVIERKMADLRPLLYLRKELFPQYGITLDFKLTMKENLLTMM